MNLALYLRNNASVLFHYHNEEKGEGYVVTFLYSVPPLHKQMYFKLKKTLKDTVGRVEISYCAPLFPTVSKLMFVTK